MVHNRYQQQGGEDVAVELEQQLLLRYGHQVDTIFFDNDSISGSLSKISEAQKAFYNKEAERKMLQKIESFKPDIAHVHNFFFNASPAVFYACHRLKIPVVLTIHNYRLICANALLMRNNKPCELCTQHIFPLSGIKYKCYRNSAFESGLVTAVTAAHKIAGTWKKKIDRYIVLTQFAFDKINHSSLSLPEGKLVIKSNFTPDPGTGLPERKKHYLFVGRISLEKGIEVMLQAFSQSGVPLLIAGEGPEKERLVRQYSEYSNIQFVGKMNEEEVINMMKECKALIFPSLWYEGLPFTIIESFSTATPVITSRLGAMEEMVRDGYNGYHFEAGDPGSLKACVEKFEQIADKQLYENARQTYLDNYTPEIHYKSIIKLYAELVEGRRLLNDQ